MWDNHMAIKRTTQHYRPNLYLAKHSGESDKMHAKARYNIIVRSLTSRNLFRPSNASKRNYPEAMLEKSRHSEVERELSANSLHTHRTNNEGANRHVCPRADTSCHEGNRSQRAMAERITTCERILVTGMCGNGQRNQKAILRYVTK